MLTLRDQDLQKWSALLADGPVLRVVNNEQGKPVAATALVSIARELGEVWKCVEDMDSLPAFIEMVESLVPLPPHADGRERLRVNLRFKIAIFSTRFHFIARVERQAPNLVTLTSEGGKVRDVTIRFELAPQTEGRTMLLCHVGFDTSSLGWLVNVFIKHHPEIEWGIHAGSAMSIAESVRALAEES